MQKSSNSSAHLFPASALLEQRIGKEHFDKVPQAPGVYRFYDAQGELLYVGKAKNLRTRLFSYKRAKAGQVSRKVSELIGRVASFVYVETETERDALLLENRMIRGDRPPYNHAKKNTETYYYLYFKPGETKLEFRLAMRIHEETERRYWHGCFKGHVPVRRSLGCLLRLLWMAENDVYDPMHLPVQLTRNLTPMRFTLHLAGRCQMPDHFNGLKEKETRRCQNSGNAPEMLTGLIHSWIKGESCELQDLLAVRIEGGKKLTPFQSLFLENHLEILGQFYDKKLVRHREIRGSKPIILQDEMDDLLVTI